MHVFIQNSQNSIGSKVQKLPDLQSQEVPSYLSPGEHRCDRCAMPPKFNITEMAIYIYIPNLKFGLVMAIYTKVYTPEMVWFGYQNSTYQDGTVSKTFWISIPSVLRGVLVLKLLIFVDI